MVIYSRDAYARIDEARAAFARAREGAGPKEAATVEALEGVGSLVMAVLAEIGELRAQIERNADRDQGL